MANKSVLYRIYADLVNALKGVIDAKLIFLKDRPKVSPDNKPMKKFAVVDLPARITDYVIGNRKTYLTTSGVIYLFTAATKEGTLDLNATGNFVDEVTALFPISGEVCVASNPAERMTGSDNEGFQVTTITFDLRCRWGAFENNKITNT